MENGFSTPNGINISNNNKSNGSLSQQKEFKNNENNNKNIETGNEVTPSGKNCNTSIITAFTFPSDNPPLIILLNKGNTTYMNSCIECLVNIKDISLHYLNNLNIIKDSLNNMPISYTFSRIIFHLFPNPKLSYQKIYSVETFHKTITFLNPLFNGKKTKDAIDFLIYFINVLNEDDKFIQNNKNKYDKNLEKNKNSIIFETFSWQSKKTEICLECKKETTKIQNYFTFDLEFQNGFSKTILNKKNEISIIDCLKYTLESNKIYNLFCQKCDMKKVFEKKSYIVSSHKYLILLLREINNQDDEMIQKLRKNNIEIKIDEILDLSSLIIDQSQRNIYRINGVIFYDPEEKEYEAFSVNPINNKWYYYKKDDSIKSCELKHFNNKEYLKKKYPVILFYKRD